MGCGERGADAGAGRAWGPKVRMGDLRTWLQGELRKRGLTQNAAVVSVGVGQARLRDMLNKGHVPKVETLFRLAHYFETFREQVLRMAGHLPATVRGEPASLWDSPPGAEEELVRALLEEFHRVPDQWKAVAVGRWPSSVPAPGRAPTGAHGRRGWRR